MSHNTNPRIAQRRHTQPKTPLRNTTMLQRLFTVLLRRPVALITTIVVVATALATVESNAQTAPVQQVKPVVPCLSALGETSWFE
jgi:hypothetical protein